MFGGRIRYTENPSRNDERKANQLLIKQKVGVQGFYLYLYL